MGSITIEMILLRVVVSSRFLGKKLRDSKSILIAHDETDRDVLMVGVVAWGGDSLK